ncbi:glutathione S-transferase [Lichenicoccus sp.]|uniref:glutathione S-transferase n=1 Tax=Lichenicoccus sp. TaxID=2781899 RepID=UPI003D0E9ECA
MADGRLVIGTRRYSSWSLRGWLAVHLAGLDVEEQVIPIAGGHTEAIARATPNGLVPYLEHRGARIWESLAIAEYCAEQAPGLWPEDRLLRAQARSVASEMHGGFRVLRLAMPMNCGRDARPLAVGISGEVAADIARVEAIWSQAAPFLHGDAFGIADAMFAPVVSRLLSYAVPLGEGAGAYRDRVRAHPLMQRWYDDAAREPAAWRLDKYEQVG